MQTTHYSNENNEMHSSTDEELHVQAVQYIHDANRIIFQELPTVISQIIEHEVWRGRPSEYKNFAQYALTRAPEGLGIANNKMLWLLKSALNKETHHSTQWAEVIEEVDTNVRSYAKKKQIPIKELSRNLTEYEHVESEHGIEDHITYLPSRSNSIDGQLLKLKKKDPQVYEEVMQNKIKLKEAWPQTPRKKILPVESVKSKFTNLSKSERAEFLAWVEQQKEDLPT